MPGGAARYMRLSLRRAGAARRGTAVWSGRGARATRSRLDIGTGNAYLYRYLESSLISRDRTPVHMRIRACSIYHTRQRRVGFSAVKE